MVPYLLPDPSLSLHLALALQGHKVRGPLLPVRDLPPAADPLLLDLGSWTLLHQSGADAPRRPTPQPLQVQGGYILPAKPQGGTPPIQVAPGKWGMLVYDSVWSNARKEFRPYWVVFDPASGQVYSVSQPFQLLHGDEERATAMIRDGRYFYVSVSAFQRECWVLVVRASTLLGRPSVIPFVLLLLGSQAGVYWAVQRLRGGRGRSPYYKMQSKV